MPVSKLFKKHKNSQNILILNFFLSDFFCFFLQKLASTITDTTEVNSIPKTKISGKYKPKKTSKTVFTAFWNWNILWNDKIGEGVVRIMRRLQIPAALANIEIFVAGSGYLAIVFKRPKQCVYVIMPKKFCVLKSKTFVNNYCCQLSRGLVTLFRRRWVN